MAFFFILDGLPRSIFVSSYPVYQINAYVREVDSLPGIYSDLNRRIHDIFQEAGLELILPHYYAQRDGNPIAMPPELIKPPQ